MAVTLTQTAAQSREGAASAVTSRPARRRSSGSYRRHPWLGMLYLTPGLIVFSVVVLIPAAQGARLSLFHWDGVTKATWVGFANYTGFFNDPTLRQAVTHTLYFIAFFAALPIVLGLLTAALSSRREVRGGGIFRSVIFLPQMLTPAVSAVVWKRIYAPNGPINDVLRALGLARFALGWLGEYTWALPALGIAGTWAAFGLCMVLFTAGMQAIPSELYDAVRVDGAGPIREFFTVTLPGLRGPLSVVLTVTMLGAIRVFDIVWLTTRGGPGISTITPTIVLYQRAFANPDIGAAAAIGVVLALVSLAIAMVVVKLSEDKA